MKNIKITNKMKLITKNVKQNEYSLKSYYKIIKKIYEG